MRKAGIIRVPPMQWDDSENAGFTTGTPWLKVNPNYKEISVKKSLEDSHSIFYYYQKLIKLRKEQEVIVYGDYNLILEDHDQIYAYTRVLDNETLLVITDFSSETPEFQLPSHIQYDSKHLLISNYEVNENEDNISSISLKPYEARVYLLK